MSKRSTVTLREGDLAPNIRLETDRGTTVQLSSFKAKNIVLYFYPRANTPGCTTEACEFRDSVRKFSRLDSVILGVSPDQAAAQSKFRAKYDLPFTLLCDVDKVAAKAFGVWREKSMYGKKVMGIERTTFVIGKDGRIKKIFSKVKPREHAAQVLEALSAL